MVISLRDFHTVEAVERPGEVVLVADDVEHGGVASAVVAGIEDGVVRFMTVFKLSSMGVTRTLRFLWIGVVPMSSGEHNGLLPILSLVRVPLLHAGDITRGLRHPSSSGSRPHMEGLLSCCVLWQPGYLPVDDDRWSWNSDAILD